MNYAKENIIVEMLVQSCTDKFGHFMSAQANSILIMLIENLKTQLADGVSASLQIGPLNRGGSVFHTSQKGGRGI
jgi:hypothetical protein